MARNQGGDWLRYENPDEKLPWLEPADDFDGRPSPLRGRLIGGFVAVVAVIGLLVAGMSWYMNSDTGPGGSGEAALIRASTTPYKVPPSDPGGMIVEGQGDTVYATGAGADPGGTIDLTAIPEEPVSRSGPAVDTSEIATAQLPPSSAARPGAPATTPKAPAPATVAKLPTAKPAAPAQIAAVVPPKTAVIQLKPAALPPKAAAPAAAPVSGGTGSYALQLGAFSSKAKADAAWKSISGRFAFVAALNKSVEPVGKGDTTLYRLRAGGIASRGSADNLCGRLKVSGDSCTVVGR